MDAVVEKMTLMKRFHLQAQAAASDEALPEPDAGSGEELVKDAALMVLAVKAKMPDVCSGMAVAL